MPNPDVSDQCQTSRVTLHYTWGQPGIESAPVGDLDLTATVWSAQRMGLWTAASGCKSQIAEIRLPQLLKADLLGAPRSAGSNAWRKRLRKSWTGSLVVFIAHKDPADPYPLSSLGTALRLAGLIKMLRAEKQPLLVTLPVSSSSSHAAQLWLVAPNSSTDTVIDYLTEDAKASVKELINGEDTSSVMMGLFLMDE